MRIEFMGMTGAGKSTLARGVSDRLRQAGCAVALGPDGFLYRHRTMLLAYKLWRAAGYGLLDPGAARAAARIARSFRQPSTIYALRLLYNWLYVSAVMAMPPRRDRIVLLEQGIGQGLYSFALRAGDVDDRRFRRLLQPVEPPDLVVFVDAPAEVVRARLRERALVHTAAERLLLADEGRAAMSRGVLERIVDVLRERSVPVERCDTHALSPAAAVDAVTALILRRLARDAGRAGPSRPVSAAAGRRRPTAE